MSKRLDTPSCLSDDQIKIVAWIARLDLEDAQRSQKALSRFLKGFRRIKSRAGEQACRISPCAKHQYSRGVCAHHYQQLKRVAAVVGWGQLASLGLCKSSGLRDIIVRKTKP